MDRPWCWMRQVHGAAVVRLGPGETSVGRPADALVSESSPEVADGDPALAVFTADCGPLVLASPEGVMAAVHVGWRGLAAGVLDRAADVMRSSGAGAISGALGPCIHAECYEFGASELDAVEEAVGGPVRARTARGTTALDLPAAVARAASRAGVELVDVSPVCTACSPDHFSHRARGDVERQALVVWRAGP